MELWQPGRKHQELNLWNKRAGSRGQCKLVRLQKTSWRREQWLGMDDGKEEGSLGEGVVCRWGRPIDFGQPLENLESQVKLGGEWHLQSLLWEQSRQDRV